MKILYFSPRECWPLNSGARLRDYHLARQLARNASVTYLGLRSPHAPAEALPPAEDGFEVVMASREPPYGFRKLLRGAIGPDPVTVLNYWSREAATALRRLLGSTRFDTVQVEGVHLVRYLPLIRAAAPGAAVIGDWHDTQSEVLERYADTVESLPRRLFARRTAKLVERAEDRLLEFCDCHTVASERERDKLRRRNPLARTHLLPNGVDVGYYSTGTPAGSEAKEIVFVGSMDYHANIDAVAWMVKEAWPRLKQRLPALQFTIVGRNPAPQVRALAAADIVVTGTVDDVRPFYRRALALAVPLRVGSGTRLKILEAMAAGVPVVSTRLGAEGLDVVDGENILLADTAAEIAVAIARLSADRALGAHLAENGRKLVTDCYDWATLGRHLYDIHRTVNRRS